VGGQRAALRSALSRRAGPRPVLDACTQVGLADDAASAESFTENNPLNGGYKEYGRHDYLPPAAFPMINAAYATKQQREESDVSGQPASGFLVSPVGKCLTQGKDGWDWADDSGISRARPPPSALRLSHGLAAFLVPPPPPYPP